MSCVKIHALTKQESRNSNHAYVSVETKFKCLRNVKNETKKHRTEFESLVSKRNHICSQNWNANVFSEKSICFERFHICLQSDSHKRRIWFRILSIRNFQNSVFFDSKNDRWFNKIDYFIIKFWDVFQVMHCQHRESISRLSRSFSILIEYKQWQFTDTISDRQTKSCINDFVLRSDKCKLYAKKFLETWMKNHNNNWLIFVVENAKESFCDRARRKQAKNDVIEKLVLWNCKLIWTNDHVTEHWELETRIWSRCKFLIARMHFLKRICKTKSHRNDLITSIDKRDR